MIWRGVFISISALIVLSGCGPKEASDASVAAAETEAYKGDLGLLQGAWKLEATNELSVCSLRVDGYRLLMDYQISVGDLHIRQNAVFERIDEARKVLVKHNNLGAWSYDLEQEDGEDRLELKFYSEHTKGWYVARLQRVKDFG